MLKHLCAPLALLALAAAGCGDSGPSKQEFIADLNAVCKKTNEKLQEVDNPQSRKQVPRFVREARPIVNESIRDVEKLELPDEDRKKFEDFISESKESLAAFDELKQAAEQNNGPELQRIVEKLAVKAEKRDVQAKKLGLSECGGG